MSDTKTLREEFDELYRWPVQSQAFDHAAYHLLSRIVRHLESCPCRQSQNSSGTSTPAAPVQSPTAPAPAAPPTPGPGWTMAANSQAADDSTHRRPHLWTKHCDRVPACRPISPPPSADGGGESSAGGSSATGESSATAATERFDLGTFTPAPATSGSARTASTATSETPTPPAADRVPEWCINGALGGFILVPNSKGRPIHVYYDAINSGLSALRAAHAAEVKRLTDERDDLKARFDKAEACALIAIRERDAAREMLRLAVEECKVWRRDDEENYYTNARRAIMRTNSHPTLRAMIEGGTT